MHKNLDLHHLRQVWNDAHSELCLRGPSRILTKERTPLKFSLHLCRVYAICREAHVGGSAHVGFVLNEDELISRSIGLRTLM